jgi:glycosyltransferase involved in cell wall biosynthesis
LLTPLSLCEASSASLYAKLLEFIKSKDIRQNSVKENCKRINNKFSWSNVVKKYEDIYEGS